MQRIAHPLLPSITQRPNYINSREEAGRYEMDLVVSCEKGTGLVQGADGNLMPQDNGTRAQVAAILHRFHALFSEK